MWYLWIHSKIQSAKKRNRLATEVWATGNSEASSTTKLISRISPRNHTSWRCALEKEGLTLYHITPLGIFYQNVNKTLCCHCLFLLDSPNLMSMIQILQAYSEGKIFEMFVIFISVFAIQIPFVKFFHLPCWDEVPFMSNYFKEKCWKGVPWICFCSHNYLIE